MALLDIKTYPESVLRQKGAKIEEISDDIRQLASDMAQTMYAAPGVGLAAPQVGRSVQMVVIDIQSGEGGGTLYTLLNPEIVRAEGKIPSEEGCLSVPDVREEITRASSVTVKAMNLDGEEITIEAEDFFAIVLQHEIDHLSGVLFIDHLSRLKQSMIKKRLRKAAAAES